jgi:hypothetical protein
MSDRCWPVPRAVSLLHRHGWTFDDPGRATRTLRGRTAWVAPVRIPDGRHVELAFGWGEPPAYHFLWREEQLVLTHIDGGRLFRRGWTRTQRARILDEPEDRDSPRHYRSNIGRPLYARGRVAAAELLNGLARGQEPVGEPAWDARRSAHPATSAAAWFDLEVAAAWSEVPVARDLARHQRFGFVSRGPADEPGWALVTLDRIVLSSGLLETLPTSDDPGEATRALAAQVRAGRGTLDAPVADLVARESSDGVAGVPSWTEARIVEGLEGAALAAAGAIPFLASPGRHLEGVLARGALRFDVVGGG